MERISLADTDTDIGRCFPIIAQLRPHLGDDTFVQRVRRQMASGYRLVFLEADGEIVAVAGFRLGENLFSGQFLYVDDLITDQERRSRDFGKRLFAWLVAHAKANGCARLELDSGVQRFQAHRFYLREGMEIRSHHFTLDLS